MKTESDYVGKMSNLLFYKDKPIFGLEINNTAFKAMTIDSKKMTVTSYGSIDVDPKKISEAIENDPSYITELLTTLLKDNIHGHLTPKRAVLGIPTIKTFSRTFTLPKKVEKNLKNAVMLEVDQYIPLPSDSLYIDYQVIERTKTNLIVLINAAPKKYIDSIYQAAKKAGIGIVMIMPNINAIARVLNKAENGNLPSVIVDVGAASTDIAILDKGIVRVTGGVAVGGNTFTLNISKKMGVSLENAYQLKVFNGLNAGSRQKSIKKAVEPSLEDITREIRRVMRYYADRVSPDTKFEQLLIVGNGANMPGLGEYMTNELLIAARVAAPWQALEFDKVEEPPKQIKPQLISVAGLACVPPKEITF